MQIESVTTAEVALLMQALRSQLDAAGLSLKQMAEHPTMNKLATALARSAAADEAKTANAEWEEKRNAELAEYDAAFPVQVGDLAMVKIGKRTYLAKVHYRSETPAGVSWKHNNRHLELQILRNDGQPHKSMNNPSSGTWSGLVRPADVEKANPNG